MSPFERLRATAAAIDERPLGERRLLSLAAVAVVAAVWFGLVQAPLHQRIQGLADENQDRQRALEAERASFAEMQRLLAADPRPVQRQQLQRNQAEIERLDAALVDKALKIISPSQMARALRDVLEQQQGLRLKSLENLPVEPAFAAMAAGGGGNATPAVFRQRVRMELSGDYLAVLRYLGALEQLPWRFQWDSLAVETDAYPVTRVVMYLSTLSLGEFWIGT